MPLIVLGKQKIQPNFKTPYLKANKFKVTKNDVWKWKP